MAEPDPFVEVPGTPPRQLPEATTSTLTIDEVGEWFRSNCDRGRAHAALLEAIVGNAALLAMSDLRTVHELVLSLAAAATGRAAAELETAVDDWASIDSFDAFQDRLYEISDQLLDGGT